MSAHARLRAATRDAHDRVDARFGAYDLRDRGQYAAFLTEHAAAFLPAEQAVAESGGEAIPSFCERRRSDALRSDLADLGLEAPARPAFGPFLSTAAMLGSAYVLEGSRLGGAVLAQEVGPDLPRRFLGTRPPAGHWRTFIAYLERHLGDEQSIADATKSALETFALFEFGAIGERT